MLVESLSVSQGIRHVWFSRNFFFWKKNWTAVFFFEVTRPRSWIGLERRTTFFLSLSRIVLTLLNLSLPSPKPSPAHKQQPFFLGLLIKRFPRIFFFVWFPTHVSIKLRPMGHCLSQTDAVQTEVTLSHKIMMQLRVFFLSTAFFFAQKWGHRFSY